MQHAAITVLASGIVVDKSKLTALSATNMAALFAEVYSLGKKVVIVENTLRFFTSKELLKQLEENGDDWPLICEHFSINVSDSERSTLRAAISIRKSLVDAVAALKPAYTFVDVPAGWSVETKLTITSQLVKRNTTGDHGYYSLGMKQAERVWLAASKFWAKVDGYATTLDSVRANGYNRTAVFGSNDVTIGCQTVRRYELEQLALHKGWAFPSN